MADSILHNVDPSSSNSHARKTHRILPLFNLTNKTAIVSGAAAGIGLEVASALAEAGANVALLYHSNTGAIMASQIITEQYGVKCKLR
jgi:sorbose reductase